MTFLLTHQPPGWLGASSRDDLANQIAPPGRFSVHLFGHQHEPQMSTRSAFGSPDRIEVLGQSLFGLESRRDYKNEKYVVREHGYSAGQVTIYPDSLGVRLWPRTGTRSLAGGWTVGADSRWDLPSDEATREYVLPRPERRLPRPASGERAAAAQPPTAQLEHRYRERALQMWDIIDLANLPEDRELATKQLDLRRLYVPLRLRPQSAQDAALGEEQFAAMEEHRARQRFRESTLQRLDDFEDVARLSLGKCIGGERRVVVLGDPGAGKTTLLRWIATAYLLRVTRDPDFAKLPDIRTLPDNDWLPVLIRCRDLKATQMGDLATILHHTLRRDEFTEAEVGPLVEMLMDRLQAGRAMLLVDGLDEIAAPSGRKRFCERLNRIARAYAKAPLIVTSRVVGYREIGRPLWQTFEHFSVAELSRADKNEFARRWIDLTEPQSRRREARKDLIRDIHSTDRVERLTANPMLLTTLALVKRQIGSLPRRRVELYYWAVYVLLTWRTDTGKRLDQREALPQLEYLAYAMCKQGVQRLSEERILALLSAMRTEYGDRIHPLKLHTPAQFLQLVERQTGILVQAGLEKSGRRAVPVFEFRHLSFQEYLAGVALADGRHPGRARDMTLPDRVAGAAALATSQVSSADGTGAEAAELWREAVRLCAVSVRDDDVDGVLEAILTPPDTATASSRTMLAALCLADEPNTSKEMADAVLRALLDDSAGGHNEAFGAPWFAESQSTEYAIREIATSYWSARFRVLISERFADPAATEIQLERLAWLGRTLAGATAPDAEQFEEWQRACIKQLGSGESDAIGAALSILGLEPWTRCLVQPELISTLCDALGGPERPAFAAASALASLCVQSHDQLWRAPTAPRAYLAAAVTPLITALSACLDDVKRSAAAALGVIGDAGAVPPLIDALRNGSGGVQAAAAAALGGIGDPTAVEPLIATLRNGSEEMRTAAASALGAIGDPRAVKPLADALRDESDLVKWSAAEALGSIGDPSAVTPLVNVLRDGTTHSTSQAAIALGSIGDPRAIKPLVDSIDVETDSWYSQSALQAFRGPRAVRPLIAALRTGSEQARCSAATALAAIADSRAVTPLIEALREGSEQTRWSAATALGAIGDPRAVKPLIDALRTGSGQVKSSAATALGVIGDSRALEPLIEVLHAGSDEIKTEAALAILRVSSEPSVSLVQGVLSGRNCLALVDMCDRDLSDRCVALASALEGDDPMVLAFRGQYVEATKGDRDEADICFERAFDAETDVDAIRADIHSRYASLLWRRGEEKRASSYFDESVEEAPDDPFVLARYGSFLLRVGKQNQRAEVAFLRSFASRAPKPGALADYALLLELRGEVTAAQGCLREALDQDRELNRFSIWLSAAAFHFRHQEFDLAQALVRPDIRPLTALALAFLRYAHLPETHREVLVQIRIAIEAGQRLRFLPYLHSNVSAALRQGHPLPKLLVVLASVLADGEPADRLKAFEEWNEAVV